MKIPWRQPKLASIGTIALALVPIAQLGLLVAAMRSEQPDFTAVNYGFSILIGLLVGATEMISRYRDEPFAPLVSVPGVFYVLLNGGAAAFAYYLLNVLNVPLREPMLTLTAGVGAMTFFRSGLFTVRVGDSDIAVGPNLILQTILAALDRIYDRQRAVPRSEAVAAIMSGLSFPRIADALPTLCFDLMQNVSETEIADFGMQKRELAASTTMSEEAKALSLGLALFNIVGERTLRAAVGALGGNVQRYARVSEELLIDLSKLDPTIVITKLPRVCAELPSNQMLQHGLRVSIPDDLGVAPESGALLTLYKLVEVFGEQRVAVAIGILSAEPQD